MWPKITDVAREAGVSVSTVSRVLNKTKNVTADLEAKVLEVVGRLGYQANQNARWLSSRRSNVIGLLMPSVSDATMAQFLHACSATLRSNNYETVVGLTDGIRRTELELIAAQASSHVSGVIFVAPAVDRRTNAELSKRVGSVLYVLSAPDLASAHSVLLDDVGAASELARRVAQAGHRHVAIIAGPAREYQVGRRIDGVVRTLEQLDLPQPAIFETESSLDGGYQAAKKVFADRTFTVAVCLSDYLAIGALRAANDCGITVPGQVAVTGFGETIYSRTCVPDLTTVRFDSQELGRLSGQTIISLIVGNDAPKRQTVGFSVVSGGSCPLSEETRGDD